MRNLTKYRLTWLYNHWTLKREGSIHLAEVFMGLTQEEAIESATRLLKDSGSALYIHHEKGQLEEKRLFPYPFIPKKTSSKQPPPDPEAQP